MAKKGKGNAEQVDQTAATLARVKLKFPRVGHLIQPFLDEYEKTENCTLSAKNVGVGHDSIAAWRKNDDFMGLFTAAHLRAQSRNNDNLKGSALQRAINGNPHYLIKNGEIIKDAKGNPVIGYRDFETNLTMFMLKNRMPDEFKDKFEHEINGQIIVTLASEFLSIVRRHVTPEVSNSIQKELETLSAKLAST